MFAVKCERRRNFSSNFSNITLKENTSSPSSTGACAKLSRPGDLVTTDYGRGLGAKILLVVTLLLIAARNKLKLTPAISKPGVGVKLALSIRIELLIALLILLTTAIITVIIGTEAIV